jgi:glycosyltransferase involved in cell wall biosynthesis
MPELLSICIPTFNRAAYLTDLLESLARDHEASPWGDEIVVYVSDNASTDTTPAVVAEFARRLPLQSRRNARNIGGDRNFSRLIDGSAGSYFWLIGDDETILPGSLAGVRELLRPQQHGLVLLPSVRAQADGQLVVLPYARGAAEAALAAPAAEVFPDYAAFIARHLAGNPFAMIGHSLLSYNIIRRDCSDRDLHRRILDSQDIYYAHMFSLAGGLRRSGASVYAGATPVVVVRQERAPVAASRLLIRRGWSRYLDWLGREYQQPALSRYGRSLFSPADRLMFALRRLSGWQPPGWGTSAAGDG